MLSSGLGLLKLFVINIRSAPRQKQEEVWTTHKQHLCSLQTLQRNVVQEWLEDLYALCLKRGWILLIQKHWMRWKLRWQNWLGISDSCPDLPPSFTITILFSPKVALQQHCNWIQMHVINVINLLSNFHHYAWHQVLCSPPNNWKRKLY